jgi:hypothetical protein
MSQFIQELKKFSKNNWWVFILFIIALSTVYITGKWNLTEIMVLFIVNFFWHLFGMIMQWNYTNRKNKVGAIYHISATIVFSSISLYGMIFLHQFQYILWQVPYIWAAIKAFTFYNFWKNIRILNEKVFVILNIFLLAIFIKFFNFEVFHIIQAIAFCLITIGLVSINDSLRYWLNAIWLFLLLSWSILWVWNSFIAGDTDWIALWFFILTLTVFSYYMKLLKKYL